LTNLPLDLSIITGISVLRKALTLLTVDGLVAIYVCWHGYCCGADHGSL
jgi:hypothetical protein